MSKLTIYEKDVLERQATHLIGTLGHVSEGKSTLIRALTGIKTQRHQKEQERNITIHLGYANCKVYQSTLTGELEAIKTSDPAPSDSTLIAHLSFVDCPGHEAFLATMLGGASIMDTACLIIASNQEVIPQPQTHEHLIAAHLMGLKRFIVLQNKLDLLSKEGAIENHKKIQKFLEGTWAEQSPLFPISAQHGWNIHHVLDSITSLSPPERNLNGPCLLTCVRSFDVNKPIQWKKEESKMIGAVIGGTLQKGVLCIGDWIEIRPGLIKEDKAYPLLTQVKGIRCEEKELPYAIPGSLIAIQTTLDPSLSIANGLVGQQIGTPGTLPALQGTLAIKFRSMNRDIHPFEKASVGDKVKVSYNVMTVSGTIIDIKKKERTIQLDAPLCVKEGAIVSVMRYHNEAHRELLEGCGEVVSTLEWEDVEQEEIPDISEQVNREIEWIPVEKSFFTPQTYSYSDFLEELEEKKEEMYSGINNKKLKLKEPVLERIPKHIVFVNWAEIVNAINNPLTAIPFKQHLKEYFESELCTTSSVNGQGQLVLAGNWKLNGVCSLLRKYVSMFKTCRQCKSTDTGLMKDGRVYKVLCGLCKSESFVDTS